MKITRLLIICALSCLPLLAQGPAISSEQILTPAELGPIETTVWPAPAIVFNGMDWLTVWRDQRALQGVYAQRVNHEGEMLLQPNTRVATSGANTLHPFGDGYLISSSNPGGPSGIARLDASFAVRETYPNTGPAVASNGDLALAWNGTLSRLQLITGSQVFPVDSESRIAPYDAQPKFIQVGAGPDSFLVLWSSQNHRAQINFNIVEADGDVRFESWRTIEQQSLDLFMVGTLWDGSRFLCAWSLTLSNHRKQLWVASIDEEGNVEKTLVAEGVIGNFQFLKAEDDLALLTWSQGATTQGRTIRNGTALGEPFLVSEHISTFADDGRGYLLELQQMNARVLRLAIDPDSTEVQSATDWRSLLSAVPDKRGLIAAAGANVVAWTDGPYESSPKVLGIFDEREPRLRETARFPENTMSVAVGHHRGVTLLIWSELHEEQTGPARIFLKAQRVTPEGEPFGEPIPIGEGRDPRVIGHGEGWLVVSQSDEQLLQYVLLGPDGRPVGSQSDVVDRIAAPGSSPATQASPHLTSLHDGDTLLVWQEGQASFTCRITCPFPESKAVIRSIRFSGSEPEDDSLRTYAGDRARVEPAAVAVGDRVLLAWLKQLVDEYDEASIESVLVDDDGELVTDVVTVGEDAEDYAFIWDRESPELIRTSSGIAIFWRGYDDIRAAHLKQVASSGTDLTITPVASFAQEITAVPEGGGAIRLFYSRAVLEGYGGTWQIGTRTLSFDASGRRRAVRP